MPLSEYACHRCGKTFEVMQKFADQPLTVHEDCGGEVERLISPPALQFKGTGWYVTDYARKSGSSGTNGSNGKSESKGEASKTDSSKTETSKTESKTDSKSENKTK